MLVALLILGLVLSVIFGVAGVAKLLDLPGSRQAAINFGLPAQLAGVAQFVLPLLEIAVAIGLLLPITAWWSALAALVLLSVFIVAIAINLQRGQTHDCHCFGQLYSRPLGWPTLARNAGFAICAGFLLMQGARDGASQSPEIAKPLGLSSSLVIGTEFTLLAIIVVVSAVVIRSRRQHPGAASTVAESPQGLPIDSPAPSFELDAYPRGRGSLAELLSAGKPLMLIFSNPKCGPCAALFQEVGKWQRAHRDQLTIAIISEGSVKDNFVNVARNSLENVLLQQEREVAKRYDATVTPTATIIRPDGTIAARPAAGADQIRDLLYSVVGPGETAEPKANSSTDLLPTADVAG